MFIPKRIQRLSLSWKLPILLAALLLLVIGTLSWAAYVEVERSVRRSVADRLDAVAQPLVTHLAAPVGAHKESVAGAARSPAVAECLRECAPSVREAAVAALGAPGDSAGYAAELLDRGGRRVLAVGRPMEAAPPGPAEREAAWEAARATGAGSAAAGEIRVIGDALVYPVLAAVTSEDTVVGWVVRWQFLTGTVAARERTARLLGAAVFVGSTGAGGGWTDLAGPAPAPAFDVAGSTGAVTYDRPGGGRRIGVAAAIPGAPWHVVVETSEAAALAPARRFLGRLGWIALVFFVLAVPAAYAMSRNITRPLRRLTDAAESYRAGEVAVSVPAERQDELGILASSFNRMIGRIRDSRRELEEKVNELRETREQFVQAQRMEAVGRLAGGIAHDFNNVLTVINAESDLALDGLAPDDPSREPFQEIRQAGDRGSGLTRQLLSFSRRQLIDPTALEVNDVVLGLESMLARLLGEDIALAVKTSPETLVAEVDRGQLEQLIVNLSVNARDALQGGGRLSITTDSVRLDDEYARTREGVEPGDHVMIAVSDTGAGMTEETKRHLFEPFFTTKPSGKGTGLGLATCQIIVREHGGHIAVYSELGVGTTVKAYFPRVDRSVDAPAADDDAPPAGGAEYILLVEDEAAVRNVARRILEKQGYRVLDAGAAEEALEILERTEEDVALLVTDVVLPGAGGRDLAERALAVRPRIRVLFISGYTDDIILHHRLTEGDAALLQKPFTAASLGRKVREVLDREAPRVAAGD